MNGFISLKALRFTLIASACLLTGFVSGANFSGINFQELFADGEISYSKISWISEVISEEKISLATVDYPASDIQNKEIKLDDFRLPSKVIYAKKSKPTRNNFKKLNAIVAQIEKKLSFDYFKDYRTASQKIRERFVLAVNKPIQNIESVVLASSSAVKQNEEKILKAAKITLKKLKVAKIKLNTQKMDIQKESKQVNKPAKPIQAVEYAQKQIPIKIKTVQSSPVFTNNIKDEVIKTEEEVLGNKLENDLLEQHIQHYVEKQQLAKPTILASIKKKPVIATQAIKPEDEIDPTKDVTNLLPEFKKEDKIQSTSCKILPKLNLIKPIVQDTIENTQICPLQKTWISKTWNEEGWAKVETEGYFPFLTYYPQVNSNDALLLDQNSIALLAIKSGIHFNHGMGIILGVLPQGYRVEFSGRSEEVQFFDFNKKKYFIFLNVEPGAGVAELISEKNENESATVFTPVLPDIVTFLDFAQPINVDIPIKIVKDNVADVIGLTVGISTQTQIQAKTGLKGTALLRNVRMIPGYPVFVDVSSKLNGERSYQYRYQLNKRTRSGIFVLNQYPEKLIFQWVKQVNLSLSDQSAMIFGQFNRKRLDGFKNNYSVKVESITEKFGMEPKSFTILWDEKLSEKDPLEGDRPRFLSVQVPEGLTQAHLVNEQNQIIQTSLIPVSPRVINVVSE